MAKADQKASKAKGKKGDAKDEKGKKGKGGGAPVLSVARHPKAGPAVRRAKGSGGLVGFVVAGALSYRANVPAFDVGLRALGVGVAAYMVAWACSVTVWRVLLIAELRVLHDQLYPPVVQPSPGADAAASQATSPGGPGAN